MAARPFMLNRYPAAAYPAAGPAAGTQFAAFRRESADPDRTGRNRMVAKVVLSIAALVAIAPGVAMIAWPNTAEQAPVRSVELHGPILGFTQSQDRIQIRLVPARSDKEKAERSRVIVRGEEGGELAIPLQRGQTWASAELPDRLAAATGLNISVE